MKFCRAYTRKVPENEEVNEERSWEILLYGAGKLLIQFLSSGDFENTTMISVRRQFQSFLLTKLKAESYSTHFYVVFYRELVP